MHNLKRKGRVNKTTSQAKYPVGKKGILQIRLRIKMASRGKKKENIVKQSSISRSSREEK